MTRAPGRGPGDAVTLADVAKEADVSLATASRVLNGSFRVVADSYRQRVESAADRLGYTANRAAQATARGTAATVALLVADIADPYFAELAAGVTRGADEAGLTVTIAVTGRGPRREVTVLQALRGQRPRGVILAASRDARAPKEALEQELAKLSAFGGRAVALGHGAADVPAVTMDNDGGAHELAVTLAAQGYRDAVCLTAAEGVVTSDERLAGFVRGFTSAGGHPPRIYRGGFTREDGRTLTAAALADGIDDGTLVFGISDVTALGAIRQLRAHGRRVGDGVAVAGFDGIAAAEDVTPELTTVRAPLEQLGYEALRAVVDSDWTPQARPLGCEVVVRASTPRR